MIRPLARPVLASILALLTTIAISCRAPAPTSAPIQVPTGQLPSDVRPVAYTLELDIDPSGERFSGVASIDVELDAAVDFLWLHGLGLDVTDVSVRPAFAEPFSATWRAADASGVARLELPQKIGPGSATVRIAYTAAFNQRLRGLYRVETAGRSYAFTQFEPTEARRAFPGFDQPDFKTTFDVTLVVPEADVAIANTPEIERTPLPGGRAAVRFATTQRLPTYLVAWAVGPFDVVGAPDLAARDPRRRALPFRGLAARGRGAELAFALERTPPLLEAMESYFGSEYPYAKLDVISVPDFSAGAMENAGAITFRDALLLLDERTAPEWQKRAFTYVMAHELAHQWFGNLVTMRWWDDLWLNEAFATWMGRRVVSEVVPEQRSDLAALESVHGAMEADSQISARSIRQPIRSHHDIHNAFDPITYSKGAGVLEMFEHWIGAERFQAGIRRYLERHRFGNATQDDLLAALSEAAGRDVATPFRSFLTRPGVPFLEVTSECRGGHGSLEVSQSRYLPVGSTGDRDGSWQVPMCARYEAGGRVLTSCELIDEPKQRIALEGGCATWVMPNAEASGYYRWSLAAADNDALMTSGWSHLDERERLSVAMNLQAAFHAGTLSAPVAFGALAPLAADAERLVAATPMRLLSLARVDLVGPSDRGRVEQQARALYRDRYDALGWNARAGESGETKLLRTSIIFFLAFTARDSEVRAEASRRGRAYLGLGSGPRPDADLVDTALAVAVQEGGREVFDTLLARLDGERDAIERSRILRALGAATDPAGAERARALSLDPHLRTNEVFDTLRTQSNQLETRSASWRWVQDHFDDLVERAGSAQSRTIPWLASTLCSEDDARSVEAFLAPRIDALEGGPRNLAGSLEAIRLCVALVEAQGAATRAYFASPQ